MALFRPAVVPILCVFIPYATGNCPTPVGCLPGHRYHTICVSLGLHLDFCWHLCSPCLLTPKDPNQRMPLVMAGSIPAPVSSPVILPLVRFKAGKATAHFWPGTINSSGVIFGAFQKASPFGSVSPLIWSKCGSSCYVNAEVMERVVRPSSSPSHPFLHH